MSPCLTEWHRIGELLQQSRFSQLTEVVFKLEHDDVEPCEHVEKWVREDLYMLEERGILYVRVIRKTEWFI